MGAYDSSKFSKLFSERTEKNLEFIEKAVNHSTSMFETDELYEVTQLLNSLMGVAVLPYEMHKDILKITQADKNELSAEKNNLTKYDMYKTLKEKISYYYKNNMLYSTYPNDKNPEDHLIVFSFLSHIRNAVCHSGDNAISILPLDEGKVIDRVLFYDKLTFYDKHTPKNKVPKITMEFAMELPIEELRDLIFAISDFYKNSPLGERNKTSTIKHAEERVKELLNPQKR